MAHSLKYGEVTTERGTFGKDEPVFVFRARDKTLVNVLSMYRSMCVNRGCEAAHVNAIEDAILAVAAWQADPGNHVRLPDTEPPPST